MNTITASMIAQPIAFRGRVVLRGAVLLGALTGTC
jgi:hypothetical protein